MSELKYLFYVMVFCSVMIFTLWIKNGCLYEHEVLPDGTHSYSVGMKCE